MFIKFRVLVIIMLIYEIPDDIHIMIKLQKFSLAKFVSRFLNDPKILFREKKGS